MRSFKEFWHPLRPRWPGLVLVWPVLMVGSMFVWGLLGIPLVGDDYLQEGFITSFIVQMKPILGDTQPQSPSM